MITRALRWGITAIVMAAAQPALSQMAMPEIVMTSAPDQPLAIPIQSGANGLSSAGETWMNYVGHGYVVRNVTRPTITPFLPHPDKATGAAVIVAPGGGFMLLAIEPEGWKVAQALADRGIAAFVLKYRIMPTPIDINAAHAFMNSKIGAAMTDPTKTPDFRYPQSTTDALAALALVRSRADEWKVDPKRVGMIGFSAGAMTSLNAVVEAAPGRGPDFFGYIYGPQAAVKVPDSAPPMFNAIAYNDELFPMMGFPIAEAWHKATRRVETHAYGRGGHGFGSGRPGTTSKMVLDQFVAWLDMEGFLQLQTPKPVE